MSDAAANQQAGALVDQGAAALKAGDRERAQRLLAQAIRLDPRNERAWLWMSGVVTSPEQRDGAPRPGESGADDSHSAATDACSPSECAVRPARAGKPAPRATAD
jgi:tetratricopeptide (TPR) repeat protein